MICVLLQAGPTDLGAADVRAEPGEGAGDGDADPDPPSQEGVRGQGRGRVPRVSYDEAIHICQVCIMVMQCSIGTTSFYLLHNTDDLGLILVATFFNQSDCLI